MPLQQTVYLVYRGHREWLPCSMSAVTGCKAVEMVANERKGTPIPRMPILMAHEAKHVICCNFDKKHRYSLVQNTIYENIQTTMVPGDSKASEKAILKSMELMIMAREIENKLTFNNNNDQDDTWVQVNMSSVQKISDLTFFKGIKLIRCVFHYADIPLNIDDFILP